MAPPPLPWMPFFCSEWLSKRSLRACTRGTRSDWLDLINVMWERQEPTLAGTAAELARMIGVTPREMASSLLELHKHGVATIDPPPKSIATGTEEFTITSRRVKRILDGRADTRERVARHRGKKKTSLHEHDQDDGVTIDDAPAVVTGNVTSPPLQRGPSEEREERENKKQEFISHAHVRDGQPQPSTPPLPAKWHAGMFRGVWERVTHKSAMVRGDLLTDAAIRCADSARVLEAADVAAHAEALVAALPRVLAWYKKSGLYAPVLSVETFLVEKHFARCEDVVKGTLDPTVVEQRAAPARARAIGRAAPAAAAAPDDPGKPAADGLVWDKPEDIR